MKTTPVLRRLGSDTLAKMLESSTSPLIITDNQQTDNPIVYANEAFITLCGYSKAEIIGKNCRFLQGEDSEKAAVHELRKAVDAGEDTRVTIKNYKKDGTEFWNDLVISPVKNQQDIVTHFVGIQFDITERIARLNELEQTQQKLLKANQELEQFTYAASHDLQEPLRMVSSYLQLLSRRYSSALNDDATTFIDFAVEGAERMQALINDLLTLSRVSSTAKLFKTVSFDEIVNRALFNLTYTIDETKADITIAKLPELSVDSTQMVQLIQNLVGNAIKYRKPASTPKISITVEKTGDTYVFSVVDNGIGIEEQYHERIFTIFQRLHTRDEYPGTGVGLSICRKIIDRHGGKIWVESNTNGGSTFKFSLPSMRKVAT
jgi:PAS domain S-box-containing protein